MKYRNPFLRARWWRWLAFAMGVSGLLLSPGRSGAAPDSWSMAADPSSPVVQALGMLHQVVSQVGDCVRRRDLSSVHLEDVLVHSAMATLKETGKSLPPSSQPAFQKELEDFARELGELHYVSDIRRQVEAERHLLLVVQGLGRIQSNFPEPTIRAAAALAERFVCPRHPERIGHRTDSCRECGMEFLQQVRLIPGQTNAASVNGATVRGLIRTDALLTVGQETRATLTLNHPAGGPVFVNDLVETYGQRLQLFVVDSSLMNLHYVIPAVTVKPGEFNFSFTPRKPGSHVAWADVRPAPAGLQEYVAMRLASDGTGEPFTNRVETSQTNAGGLNFDVSFGTPTIRAQQPAGGRLHVSQADGSGFERLEPFAGAFVQWIGICENRETIFRFSSKGRPVLNAQARGGPDLEFLFTSPRAGFVRLFAIVQVEGAPVVASFGVMVNP